MQLDAFLRSAKKYAPYASIEICYASGLEFEQEVRGFLRAHERVVFHTDDDVFFAAPSAVFLVASYYTQSHVGTPISFRLGENTTYCHPLDRGQEVPYALVACPPWLWRNADGDFGYPLCLNGTVYRSADLLPLLDFHFRNPTELEAGLDYRKEHCQPKWMTAPRRSCCVSLPHNRVSVSSGCRTGTNPGWQPAALQERYLAGERIDLDAMDFSQITSAHQEVPLVFTRR